MKVLAVLTFETVVALLGSALDSTSQKVVLYSAALAGALWAWVHVVLPLLRRLRSVFRSAEVFEQLPEIVASIEAEVGRVLAAVTRIENRQAAANRELGVQARGDAGAPTEEFDAVDDRQGPTAPE